MGRVSAFSGWRKSGLFLFALATVAVLAASPAAAQNPKTYVITPLVSNNGAAGTAVDAHLVNAWGLVAGPTTPWWVSDNGADLSTLYNAAGTKIPLEVSVAEAPTGVVFNGGSSSFLIGGARARFIFSTERGTIAAGNRRPRVAQPGPLNAPWGAAMAPASFGAFGGDLLVGNFGDGHVNAYQELPDGTWELVGTLRTADGKKLAIDGLWALEFGHGSPANGPLGTLFFTAGPNHHTGGRFRP